MTWWSDLWIIESMAVYMSNIALDQDAKQRFPKDNKTLNLLNFKYRAAEDDM